MSRRKEPTIPNELLDQLLAGSAASAAFERGGLLDSLKKADSSRTSIAACSSVRSPSSVHASLFRLAMIKGLVAGVLNLSVGRGAVLSPVESIAAASVVGFFGYGVSLVFFVLGLRHLGSARTGAYFSMAPFIGALIAIGLFGEPATVRLIIAALLMGIGLYLHLAERHAHEHKHDPLEHTHNHVHDAHHQHCLGPEDAKGEPHSHVHRHEPLVHAHAHYPDLHDRHRHVG